MADGLVAVEEYVKTILISSKVKGIKPLSGILISHVDAGKSAVLLQFQGNKGITVLSDATSFGIITNLLKGIGNGDISHIIIPDFLKIMERSKRVSSELISLLNTLAEEGFTGSLTQNVQIIVDKPLICGFITAITIDRYQSAKKGWSKIGFSSRIIPFFFGYEEEDLKSASKSILYEENVFTKISLPDIEPVEVKISDKYRDEIGVIADFAAKVNEDFTAFRTKRNMLGFVKSHALVKERHEVNDEDIQFLKSLIPFWFDPIFGNDCDYYILQNLPATAQEMVKSLKDKYSQSTIYRRLKAMEERKIIYDEGGRWNICY